MTKPSLLSQFKSMLTESGITATDAELKAMTETLKQNYADSVTESKATSQQPRTSTRKDVLESGRAANTVNHEAAMNSLEAQRGALDIHTDARNNRIEGDINKHAALTDANTNSQLALMGGSFRQMQQDAFASKDRTVKGHLDYYSGRDDKYVDVIKGDQALAGRGMNMDFIGKLVAGAALMAG